MYTPFHKRLRTRSSHWHLLLALCLARRLVLTPFLAASSPHLLKREPGHSAQALWTPLVLKVREHCNTYAPFWIWAYFPCDLFVQCLPQWGTMILSKGCRVFLTRSTLPCSPNAPTVWKLEENKAFSPVPHDAPKSCQNSPATFCSVLTFPPHHLCSVTHRTSPEGVFPRVVYFLQGGGKGEEEFRTDMVEYPFQPHSSYRHSLITSIYSNNATW